MIKVRKTEERGRSALSWLDSAHTFSFSGYYDPRYMGLGCLRVINDDTVAPSAGFDTHGHRDMEIISYVLDGELVHADSMGFGSTMRYGDVQRMSAGTGVQHSEFNGSEHMPLHFLQIWIIPDQLHYEPRYEQKYFSPEQKRGRFCLVASNAGRDGSIHIHQDVDMYAGCFDKGEEACFEVNTGRMLWLHVAKGSIVINGDRYKEGDGLACSEGEVLTLTQGKEAEVILFDLAVNAKMPEGLL